jgi:hypothetical protein
MMEVHTFFIALVVLLIGFLCFFYSKELINEPFGRIISFGLGIFWAIRLVFQLVVYSPKLWIGNTFYTIVHIVFSILWTYMAVVFFKIYFS